MATSKSQARRPAVKEDPTLAQLSREYERLCRAEADADAQAKQAMQERLACERRFIDLLDQREEKAFVRSDGERFTKVSTIYAKVEDPEALMDALREEGLEDEYTRREFQKARLNAWVNKALDEGTAFLDGLSYSVKTYIRGGLGGRTKEG